MNITYTTERTVSVEEFRSILNRSTLGERRPVNDDTVLSSMIEHANLTCAAWEGSKLVGIARSVTDFDYCCYLSDLAVDTDYQNHGIGKELISLTRSKLGPNATLILLSAPKATGYYPKIGFTKHESAWTMKAEQASGTDDEQPGAAHR